MILNGRFGSLEVVQANISLMSAFPESGRSETRKRMKSKVRFRLEAAIQIDRKRAPLPRQGPQPTATKVQ